MFRIYQLLSRERNGYYTYDQIVESIGYARADPVWKLPNSVLLDHLTRISTMMRNYKMDIVLAREVLDYDETCDFIVGTCKIHPNPFKTINKDAYTERKITAPNYRNANFCGNCVHFDDQTEQDNMLSGVCKIHTETNADYDPQLKEPLQLSCYEVCDDFVMNGEP